MLKTLKKVWNFLKKWSTPIINILLILGFYGIIKIGGVWFFGGFAIGFVVGMNVVLLQSSLFLTIYGYVRKLQNKNTEHINIFLKVLEDEGKERKANIKRK